MAVLRSLLFNLLFYPGTLIHCVAVVAVSPFGSGPVQAVVHSWSRMHYWLIRHVMAIRFEWDGAIPPGPHLIAVKHESMVEACGGDRRACAQLSTPGGRRRPAASPVH
mgnify:CR=1 FL=1